MKTAVTVTRKVITGKYETADVSISLSDVEEGTTLEEINEMLDTTSKTVFGAIAARVNASVKSIKEQSHD